MAKKIEITNHFLVPKHTKVSEREKKEVFEKYGVTLNELPKILISDPAIAGLSLVEGDVVKVVRESQTAGKTVFYRGVVND